MSERVVTVQRGISLGRRLGKSALLPPPEIPDPWGQFGEAVYDDLGLKRVTWNKPHPVYGRTVILQTEHDESVPVEDRVPLVDWERGDE